MTAAKAFLAASAALARENPAAHARVTGHIARLRIHCRIGAEDFVIHVHRDVLQASPADHGPWHLAALGPHQIEVEIAPAVIVDLLDGVFGADQAVRMRLLWLRGEPRALADLSRGARAFLHGASFSRGAEHVLAGYRASVQKARETM